MRSDNKYKNLSGNIEISLIAKTPEYVNAFLNMKISS